MKSENLAIGEKVKNLREINKWSQEDLAFRMGINRPAISQIESGGRSMSLLEAMTMSKLANTTLDYWTDGNASPPNEKQLYDEHIALVKRETQLTIMLDIIAESRALTSVSEVDADRRKIVVTSVMNIYAKINKP